MRSLLVVAFVVLAGTAGAQTPVAAPSSAPAAAAAASGAQTEPYSYSTDGRRDPFVNLLNTGVDPHAQSGRRPEGPAGIAAAELAVSGVLQSRGAYVAMVTGADKRSYVVHAGDKLFDGVVKAVTPEGLVIVQDVNDPLSPIKKREIRKLLRALEDAKE
jgi:Tfp pilus assembly protein PilP